MTKKLKRVDGSDSGLRVTQLVPRRIYKAVGAILITREQLIQAFTQWDEADKISPQQRGDTTSKQYGTACADYLIQLIRK